MHRHDRHARTRTTAHPVRVHTARRLRGDRCVCALAQHRLRGVAEVAAVRVRVIAWVRRSGHSTTLRACTWRDTIDLHDDRHARGIACAVMPSISFASRSYCMDRSRRLPTLLAEHGWETTGCLHVARRQRRDKQQGGQSSAEEEHVVVWVVIWVCGDGWGRVKLG